MIKDLCKKPRNDNIMRIRFCSLNHSWRADADIASRGIFTEIQEVAIAVITIIFTLISVNTLFENEISDQKKSEASNSNLI